MMTQYSTLKCPLCGHQQKHPIPEANVHVIVYKCGGCGKLIQSRISGCVICDYGTPPCPKPHK